MADTKISALTAVTTPAGTDEFAVNQSAASKKVTLDQIKTFVNQDTIKVVASDQANSTTTAAAVTDLSLTVAAGTYLAKYWIVYRTAATTTGIQMYLRHDGTTTRLAATWYTLTTGGAAATGIADQATTATAQLMEGKGQRASNVASGSTQGVDTVSADQFAVMEGLIIVTVSGTLDLMFNSEVAASAATIMTGTSLVLSKVA
ncbi:MAG: hypothetical protein V4515_12395 [Chloroflexota bacterium]